MFICSLNPARTGDVCRPFFVMMQVHSIDSFTLLLRSISNACEPVPFCSCGFSSTAFIIVGGLSSTQTRARSAFFSANSIICCQLLPINFEILPTWLFVCWAACLPHHSTTNWLPAFFMLKFACRIHAFTFCLQMWTWIRTLVFCF